MSSAGESIELALVSHTNAGKTTLARTLLGRDVGEVRNLPHVTEIAEAHTLAETDAGDVLRLWDTPGFGDSARLLARLRVADNPIGCCCVKSGTATATGLSGAASRLCARPASRPM